MAEPVTGTFETKQIHELNPLAKLTGKEEVLIDDGNGTLRVTVDTLLGYIRDQINASTGGGSGAGADPSQEQASTIHVIRIDEGEEDIPVESRPEGHFYIKVIDAIEAQLSSGLPRVIRVSPNMGLRIIDD